MITVTFQCKQRSYRPKDCPLQQGHEWTQQLLVTWRPWVYTSSSAGGSLEPLTQCFVSMPQASAKCTKSVNTLLGCCEFGNDRLITVKCMEFRDSHHQRWLPRPKGTEVLVASLKLQWVISEERCAHPSARWLLRRTPVFDVTQANHGCLMGWVEPYRGEGFPRLGHKCYPYILDHFGEASYYIIVALMQIWDQAMVEGNWSCTPQ